MKTYRLGYLVAALAIGTLHATACTNSYPAASPSLVETATIVDLPPPPVPPTIEHEIVPSLTSTSVPSPIPHIPTSIEATGRVGSCEFRLELAYNNVERGKGLMGRSSMPMDQGMLFIFDLEEELSFWMRNTIIPLDIIFFDRTLMVVDVQSMIPEHEVLPHPLPFYTSAAPAKFALEINAGVAANCSIKLGDTMNVNYLFD